MKAIPIQTLVRSLTKLFNEPETDALRIADLLQTYASSHDDWRSYALDQPGRYTRNLVELNSQYELLVLCWDRDQCSPIHNHEGQDCWMAVLDGPMRELHFEMPAAEGPLTPGPSQHLETGHVAYISDEIALHQVMTTPDAPAVSLHLYANPYSECNLYCPDTGKITRVPLSYYSVNGVLNGDPSAH